MRTRTRSLIAAAVLALGALPATAVSAGTDHVQSLRSICEAKGGAWAPRPGWWQARCSRQRASNGQDSGAHQAMVICTMQMDGIFYLGVDPDDGATSWVCL